MTARYFVVMAVIVWSSAFVSAATAQVISAPVSAPFTYKQFNGDVVDQGDAFGGGSYAGPALTSSGVVWGEARRNRLRLLGAGPGAVKRRTIREIVGPGSVEADIYSRLSAGSGFLAVGYGTIGRPAGQLEDSGTDGGVAVIADGGPTTLLASGCTSACSPDLAAADGETVAYVVRSSQPGRDRETLIRNIRTGGEVRVPVDGTYGDLAGRYLSYTSRTADNALVVYDWVAQREIYRLPGQGTGLAGNFSAGPELSALQGDGTVVFRAADGRPAWASPAAPSPQRLPVAAGTYRGVSLNAGKAVLARFKGQRSPVGELVLVPLGGRAQLLATNVAANIPPDLKGERAAFFDRTCKGLRVVAAPLNALATRRWTKRRTCQLPLRTKLRRKRNRLQTRFGCGPYRGALCTLTSVRVRAAKSYRVGKTRIRAGRLLASTRTARNGRASLALTSLGKRGLGRNPVRVRMSGYSSTTSLPGTERQTITVTIPG